MLPGLVGCYLWAIAHILAINSCLLRTSKSWIQGTASNNCRAMMPSFHYDLLSSIPLYRSYENKFYLSKLSQSRASIADKLKNVSIAGQEHKGVVIKTTCCRPLIDHDWLRHQNNVKWATLPWVLASRWARFNWLCALLCNMADDPGARVPCA